MGPHVIEGLKPNVTQLAYHNSISHSQNPLSPAKLKSGEYDMKMNRTVGQDIISNIRLGNLLPNIAKNMIPPE
jgi:hypothetical protein